MDFGGGVLSILQMDIYCFIEHSNTQITGNIPKLALGLVTLLFDIILVWQHYVFYLGNEQVSEEEKPLLNGSKKEKIYSRDVNADDEDLQEKSISLSDTSRSTRENELWQNDSNDSIV